MIRKDVALSALCRLLSISEGSLAAPTLPKIIDDPQLDAAIFEVRSQFLATQPFKRLDVVLLLPNKDGSWRRGSYHPDALAYPASCVKLAYMVSAVHWCSTQKFEGATTVRLNQQIWGNRWVKLGDFNFEAGQGTIVLSNQVAQPSHPVSAAIVKITAYPAGN